MTTTKKTTYEKGTQHLHLREQYLVSALPTDVS